jgi:hypothetical protein
MTKVYVKPEPKPEPAPVVVEKEPERIEPTFRNIYGLAVACGFFVGVCVMLAIHLY